MEEFSQDLAYAESCTDLDEILIGNGYMEQPLYFAEAGVYGNGYYPYIHVMDDDVAMQLILKDGKECLDAAANAGITLEPYEEYDFYQAFKRGNEATNDASIALIREIWQPHYKLTASMAQDLMKGRKCEIYDINGVVCDTGRKYGIPTPVNDRIVEVVAGIQDGKYQYSPENIKYFKDLL